MPTAGATSTYQLLGPDGRPLLGTDGFLVPHARTFSGILNGVSRTYATRFDEALRAGKEDVLATRRDAFYTSLLQERATPTANLDHSVCVEDEGDPGQVAVRDLAAKLLARFAGLSAAKESLMDALWDGRAGVQVLPTRYPDGLWGVGDWVPVHGDKIQSSWDRTPIILVNAMAAAEAERQSPGCVVRTDGSAPGLLLRDPRWRERFVIHRHRVTDADFGEGAMAGSVGGVGYRHYCQWAAWMRSEAATWMLGFVDSVGMMDILVFNFPEGNAEAQKRAEANAREVSGKVAFALPRSKGENYPAIETIQANAAGMSALRELIGGYYERHIERSIVGQTLSASSEGSGLGGSGVAAFHRDTKFQLVKLDAKKLSETLSRDLVAPLVRWNAPGTRFRVWLELAVPDPDAPAKLQAAQTLVQMGVPVLTRELYKLATLTVPRQGEDTVGGDNPQSKTENDLAGANPDDAGGNVSTPPANPPPDSADVSGDGGGESEAAEDQDYSWLADLFALHGPDGAELYHGLSKEWDSHTIASGPRKGQRVFKNARTGELRDSLSARERAADAGRAGAKAAAEAAKFAGDKKADLAAWAGRKKEWAVGNLEPSWRGRRVLDAAWASKLLAKGAHHALLYAMHKSQELAVEAAAERGMGEDGQKRLQRTLGLLDFIGGYAPAIAGGVAFGAVGAKVGSLVPTASLAYLVYSTARSPGATWRAALTVAKRFVGAAPARLHSVGGAAETYSADAGDADSLADLLASYDGDGDAQEWAVAVVAASVASGAAVEDAVALAERAPHPAELGGPESYALEDWLPHTIQSGPRKGQKAVKNRVTGELRDSAPAARPPAAPARPAERNGGEGTPQHPIAAHLAADAKTRNIVEGVRKLAATADDLDAATADADAAYAEWAKHPQGQAPREAIDAFLTTHERFKAARAAAESANAKVRNAIVKVLKPEKPITFATRDYAGGKADSHIASYQEAGAAKATSKRSLENAKLGVEAALGFLRATAADAGETVSVEFGVSRDGRAFARDAKGTKNGVAHVAMGRHDTAEAAAATAVHELAHAMEGSDPRLSAYCRAFLAYRVGDEPYTDFKDLPGGEAMAGEKGRKDHFDRAFGEVSAYYCGKDYPNGATEILSKGLEELYRDPVKFMSRDPEYAAFVIGVLGGDRGPSPAQPGD